MTINFEQDRVESITQIDAAKTLSDKVLKLKDLEDQMNTIIEAFEFASDSYWGDPERFMFRAKIDEFPTITSVSANADRANKSEFTITVNAYIIPSTANVAAAGPNPKAYNITKAIFKERTT